MQYVYIGLSDENQEGLYEWVDGSEVQITMWDAAQPDNDPNTRDCTEMNADTVRIKMCKIALYAY